MGQNDPCKSWTPIMEHLTTGRCTALQQRDPLHEESLWPSESGSALEYLPKCLVATIPGHHYPF